MMFPSPPLAQDSVDGLIWSTENLARLDGYPDIKVVYRTDWSKDKVGAPKVAGTGKLW
jgi:dihydroxyacetone kinase